MIYIKFLISQILYFLIFVIDFLESCFYPEPNDIENQVVDTISLQNISVLTNTGYEPLKFIHKGRRDYLYTLKFSDGKILRCADDHPLVIRDRTNLILTVKTKNLRVGNQIQIQDGFTTLISKTRSIFKYSQMDLTVDSEQHVYYANGILVHNCVTFDTDVSVFDEKTQTYSKKPIFEMFYGSIKNKSLGLKFELFLFRILYKIRLKMKP